MNTRWRHSQEDAYVYGCIPLRVFQVIKFNLWCISLGNDSNSKLVNYFLFFQIQAFSFEHLFHHNSSATLIYLDLYIYVNIYLYMYTDLFFTIIPQRKTTKRQWKGLDVALQMWLRAVKRDIRISLAVREAELGLGVNWWPLVSDKKGWKNVKKHGSVL